MNLDNPRRTELSGIPYLNVALDWILARVNYVWAVQHDPETGVHTAITGESISVTGNATTGGASLTTGDVIALHGTGTECGIGTLATVDGTALLPAEVSRQGLLLGGVATGTFTEWRAAQSPFVSGKELAVWNLGYSTTRPLFRVGVLSGVPTLIDGGSGASLSLGDLTEPLAAVFTNVLVANSAVTEAGVISAAVTADQNDWNPTGLATARVIRIQTDASRTITGLSALTAGDGRVISIVNIDTPDAVLAHESGLSTAANRFICPGGVNYTLTVGSAATVWYDGLSSRWRFRHS